MEEIRRGGGTKRPHIHIKGERQGASCRISSREDPYKPISKEEISNSTLRRDIFSSYVLFHPRNIRQRPNLRTWPQTKSTHTYQINILFIGSLNWESESLREENSFSFSRRPSWRCYLCIFRHAPGGSVRLFSRSSDLNRRVSHPLEDGTLTWCILAISRGHPKINARDLRPRIEDLISDPNTCYIIFFLLSYYKWWFYHSQQANIAFWATGNTTNNFIDDSIMGNSTWLTRIHDKRLYLHHIHYLLFYL